jgi:hypothetical protein
MIVTTASHLIALKAIPHAEGRVNYPVPAAEFEGLLGQAAELLNVNENEFNVSIRHVKLKTSPWLSSEERMTFNS